MKFMIVTSNQPWGEAVCGMAKKIGFTEALITSHEQALEKFLEASPTHVLVGEYESHKGVQDRPHFDPAHKSWEDLTNAASPGQIIRRCGFVNRNEPDFIRLPFDEEGFKKAFNLP